MIIQYTPEEQQHIQDIKNKYEPDIQQIRQELRVVTADPEHKKDELSAITKRLFVVMHERQMAIEAYSRQCQQLRFQQIRQGGTPAIIEDAKAQAPLILEYMHGLLTDTYSDMSPAVLKELQIGTLQDGFLLINASTAASLLNDELRLHLDALQDDKEALQKVLELIIDTVENSPYTSSEEIVDDTGTLSEIKRYRRSSLAEIKSYYLMNDKTSAELLQDGEIFQQPWDGQTVLRWGVNQSPEGQGEVPVFIALAYEGTEDKITKHLTGYDKSVYEAVSTRYNEWRRTGQQRPLYITPQEVWRTINGKLSSDGKAKPSSAQVRKICASLDKMRFTHFYMDISEEIKAHYITVDDERITGGKIDCYLLNCNKVEFVTEKGNIVTGYRISEEPILYTYNAIKKRLLKVPYEMLDTSAYTSDSENVVEFRSYLLQQIQLMKNAEEENKNGKGKYFKRSHTILLKTIYEKTGIQTPEERAAASASTGNAQKTYLRKTRKADRDKIEGILDAWKAKGWIKGYTVLNSNGQPIGEKQQAKGYSISI